MFRNKAYREALRNGKGNPHATRVQEYMHSFKGEAGREKWEYGQKTSLLNNKIDLLEKQIQLFIGDGTLKEKVQSILENILTLKTADKIGYLIKLDNLLDPFIEFKSVAIILGNIRPMLNALLEEATEEEVRTFLRSAP